MDIKEINSFMGKSIEYWVELDAYVKENMYDKLIESNVILKARIKELEEGIKKHRNTKIESNYKIEQMELRDEELYKLVERESK